jgi:hypothetical protein
LVEHTTENRGVGSSILPLAISQHGVISIRQLLGAGLSRNAVSRRVEKRALHREFRGVYRVGHQAPHTEARYLAAVLACGEDAVLSGHAAACLLGLIRGAVPPPRSARPPTDRWWVSLLGEFAASTSAMSPSIVRSRSRRATNPRRPCRFAVARGRRLRESRTLPARPDARGDEFRRYTYGDVAEDQSLMLAELTALLAGSRRS